MDRIEEEIKKTESMQSIDEYPSQNSQNNFISKHSK